MNKTRCLFQTQGPILDTVSREERFRSVRVLKVISLRTSPVTSRHCRRPYDLKQLTPTSGSCRLGFRRLDDRLQTRLATSGVILVNHTLAGGTIQMTGSSAELGLGHVDFSVTESRDDLLDLRLHRRLCGPVTVSSLEILTQSLLGTLGIGHSSF